jgi:TRAP-type C4-dicarboxylate transport system substrate-binding protein
VIDSVKFYEVQKYCSLTNHMWDGYWLLANRRAFERLPEDAREVVAREFNRSALDQRQDVAKLNGELSGKLTSAGLKFNNVEPEGFRDRLRTAGFYKDWRGRFGDEAWQLLEAAVGALS